MSNLYNLEPQPTAKAILKTTAGDVSLELFAKQTPLACRNFLQHCLDGYYNNTILHRLIPGFIIQGGDPTGTGSGGISAIQNGDGFANEIHSRLKFNRRGLLGMANEETENSNGSQFFLTLGSTPELQGKNTMLGRVEGDTIYNLMKMAEAELVEGSERPLYPTRITGAEILVNPFVDMVVRAKEAPRVMDVDAAKKEVKKRKKPAGKNVLSFGGDEGEDGIDAPVLKKSKANPKLVAVASEDLEETPATVPKEKKASKPNRRKSPTPESESDDDERAPLTIAKKKLPRDKSPPSPELVQPVETMTVLEKTNAEIAALKAIMKRNVDTNSHEKHQKPKNALEAMIPVTSTRGRKRGKAGDERGAIDLFKAFKQRLEDMPTEHTATNGDAVPSIAPTTSEPPVAGGEDDDAELCDLHFIANCQSCKSWEGQDDPEVAAGDDEDGAAWMSHRLTFARDTLGKDLEWKKKMEEIEVIDPLEKARAIKEEQKKKKDKKKT